MASRATVVVALCGATALLSAPAFLAVPPRAEVSRSSAATIATGLLAASPAAGPSAVSALGLGLACGLVAAATAASAARASRTARRYTTQTILPSFCWLKTGLKGSDLDGGILEAVCLQSVDVVVGKTESGQLFAVADKCPPTGTSLCIGGEVVGDTVVDGQYGTVYNVFTGNPEVWCPSPPVIGSVVGALMGGPQLLQTFEIRQAFLGGEVEVLVDINMRKAYEADYWKGLLDAQGKDDGTYY